ncbi:alpha-methylacyl-CoA racemase [Amyelois transitella]|uniref:alpha-methylacyl-CoA racemase n=1 Tax=Amyelois transitella TaxID=680683 RepID=UPI00298FE79B|nr:alpha-methylacyl-CoA racemase [Amyelois transitella]XP_060809695.1 alpha-methylacyl-CoA racemase [Amyelois transitella]
MALKGIKVIEMMGLAPGPFCGSILADFGAMVTVIQKMQPSPFDVMSNGKRMISIDLKREEGITIVKNMCSKSDVFLDTFRPGVLEKIGLGPNELLMANPRLIYARLTGYGQNGYLKDKAGHDINYVAMSGILSLLRSRDRVPSPPINLLADFAGGSVLCTLGIVLALFERTISGKGQIIDANMTEGVAYIASWLFRSRNLPIWSGEPGTNVLDGGVPFYKTYRTKDNKFMAVGALEPQFYSEFLKGLKLSEDEYGQSDLEKCSKKFEELFLQKTQDEWCCIFDQLDACVTPVLEFDSVDRQKYYAQRNFFNRNSNNCIVPDPVPKFSKTPGKSVGTKPLPKPGQDTVDILRELGYDKMYINELIKKGLVYSSKKCNL